MTGSTEPADRGQPLSRPPSRRIVTAALRVAGSVTALVALYYVLPLDHSSITFAVVSLLIGLAAFIVLVAFQIRAIIRTAFPVLRAAEALATSATLFLLLFASTYVALAEQSSSTFGEHLSHTDGLYFTVSVFTTVGFGDITAKSQLARSLVTIQMITDLIILGLAVKLTVGAVHRSRGGHAAPGATSGQGTSAPGGG